MKLRKKNVFMLVGLVVVVILMVIVALFCRVQYELADGLVFEVNAEKTVGDLFKKVDFGGLENVETQVDTSQIGEKTQIVGLVNLFGMAEEVNVTYEVVDTTVPLINGEEEIYIFKNDEFRISDYFEISDNSLTDVEMSVEGACDTTVIGVCDLKIVARDWLGNETSKDVRLNVIEDTEISDLGQNEYYIRVNRSQNVVMVYALDRNGEYSKLTKTFVSSTGKVGSETPLGTFVVSDRYEALFLVGNVWGRYAVRINGPYFFHSVPYFSRGDQVWDDLEYLEYNKLGEGASAGCVRLAVRDAKWIYDNISPGTVVEIYDADDLPEGVVKPEAIKIDENSERRGFDPTDW